MKTSELTGAALDWAVAKSKKYPGWDPEKDYKSWPAQKFSTEWASGGPIIERELLQVSPRFLSAGYEHPNGLWVWEAFVLGPENIDDNFCQTGRTPLIAAMRCYVASKLGDTVEVPGELL